MNKWRLAAAGVFSAISAAGINRTYSNNVEATQVLVGIGAFIAIWIAVYLFVTKGKK